MEINKSQKLIIGVVISAVLGLPDINKIFTEEIIKIALQDLSPIMIILVSLLKLLLVVSSVYWLIKLSQNIEITHRTKSKDAFKYYFLKLGLTGIVSFIVMLLVKQIIYI